MKTGSPPDSNVNSIRTNPVFFDGPEFIAIYRIIRENTGNDVYSLGAAILTPRNKKPFILFEYDSKDGKHQITCNQLAEFILKDHFTRFTNKDLKVESITPREETALTPKRAKVISDDEDFIHNTLNSNSKKDLEGQFHAIIRIERFSSSIPAFKKLEEMARKLAPENGRHL